MADSPRRGTPAPRDGNAAAAETEQAEEARRILEQSARDSHTVFGGALRAMFGATSAGEDRTADDPVERWGKIVGRVVGYGLALFLLFSLLSGWWR